MWRDLQQKLQGGLVRWQVSLLPGVLVISGVILLRSLGLFQGLEWGLFDRYLRWRPAEPMDERILIVGINEQDIQQLKTYPVSDAELAGLIDRLQSFQPVAIGVDIFRNNPVEPGSTRLNQVFRTQNNVIGIEKVVVQSGEVAVPAAQALPKEQVGFADAPLDKDGALRRSLLFTEDAAGELHTSLSMLLAESYLGSRNILIQDGQKDPGSIRFGAIELPRFSQGKTGIVSLLNFRSGPRPFRVISLGDVKAGNFQPDWVKGKIVLIGIMSPAVRDYVNSQAIHSFNPALIYGVEAQAHGVSQLISAGVDQRPFIQVWSEPWTYLWIALWGGGGILLGWVVRSPFKWLGLLALGVGSLVLLGYGAILMAWWIPIMPSLVVFLINGAGLTAFYRYDQGLRARLQDRQLVIDEAFNAIHNGPLQVLSSLQRRSKTEPLTATDLLGQLEILDQSIRKIYDSMRLEALSPSSSTYISETLQVDLEEPLHEVLQQVYTDVLSRNLPCFQGLKIKVINFEPLDERSLNPELKLGLCRFLEEALSNVGKHATEATKLEISCAQSAGQNRLRVVDNGHGLLADHEGMGTRQAKQLAKRLRGAFERSNVSPRGILCQISWKSHRR
jgi:CHASE2 domain-containing sensor protein/two-component sensor histidine kinase